MEQQYEWISQGDVFRSVPLARVTWMNGRHKVSEQMAPAVLLTHGCDLDKRTGKGATRIETLQWLPLRSTEGVDQQRLAILRKKLDNPPEAFYLGDVPGLSWEAFTLLSEVCSMPAAAHQPEMQSFEGMCGADKSDPNHLVFGRHSDRLGRLDSDQVALLYRKVTLFWTRGEAALAQSEMFPNAR